MNKAIRESFSPGEILRTNSLKVTPGRKKVLDFLANCGRPVSIDTLKQRLGKTLNTTTIYRILEKFVKKGLVSRTDFWDGKSYFEYQHHHHHHITCSECGRQEEVQVCIEKDLEKIISTSRHFRKIDNHMIEFFGLCRKCTDRNVLCR